MCGRFTNRYTWAELVRLYRLTGSPPTSNFQPQYNIAPTQNSFVVRLNDGRRDLVEMRWGLIPYWAKDAKIGSRLINAQSETCAAKPAFRYAFKARRCLVVADAFYEWPTRDTPRLITVKNNEAFAFAGLWESWRTNEGDKKRLETFTILTTTANAFMAPIHDRMPVILSPDAWPIWLGETKASGEQLLALCRPYASDRMTSWAVSPRVGNVRNTDASLVDPLPEAAE
jgi:putative SOS response-associated peptidase YedK